MQVLETSLPFDEAAALTDNMDYLCRSIGIAEIRICSADGPDVPEGVLARDGPYPAEPRVILETEERTVE